MGVNSRTRHLNEAYHALECALADISEAEGHLGACGVITDMRRASEQLRTVLRCVDAVLEEDEGEGE